jgi:hypothetical protein
MDASKPHPAEVLVLDTVYDAAMERARRQGQKLAAVARMALFEEAAKTPEDAVAPAGRPPLRPYGQKRKKIKFKVSVDAYRQAEDRILASGRSVGAAIEDALSTYARTGNL